MKPKIKNPIAKALRSPHLRKKVVKPKKGKGAAKRPRLKEKLAVIMPRQLLTDRAEISPSNFYNAKGVGTNSPSCH